jgi:hypothetical protein
MKLPILFSEKAKSPKAAAGYPVQISAGDLDKNFQFAALDAEAGYIQETGGAAGNKGRKLRLPPIPPSGTHVLGAVEGSLIWIETEDCE